MSFSIREHLAASFPIRKYLAASFSICEYLAACCVVLCCVSVLGAAPLVHTYSIVAVDRERGQIGVAVQSHWFAVGARCAWARPGVGAIATQAMTDPRYGRMGLALLALGQDPATAFATVAAEDRSAEARQVSLIDARGRRHGHTGRLCIPDARHRVGTDYVAAANLMVDDSVVPAMGAAFESARGELGDRLLAALEGAQRAGGDLRGMQSAVLKVVRTDPLGDPWKDVVVDLRVDDHRRPLRELGRLLRLQQAYAARSLSEEALVARDWAAADMLHRRACRLAPGQREFDFWYALGLARAGRMDEARKLWRRRIGRRREWWSLLGRLPGTSVLEDAAAGRRLIEDFVRGLPAPR